MNSENVLFELREILKDKTGIEFWSLESVQLRRKEYYMCLSDDKPSLNQSRKISSQNIFVSLWTSGEDDRLGFGVSKIDQELDLSEQIDRLIKKSKLASEKKWRPETPFQKNKKPQALLCAPQFIEDFDRASDQIMGDLLKSIEATKGAEFNSAELFCSINDHLVLSSNGFSSSYQKSKIYGEVCFSANENGDSQEFLETRWAVRPEDIDFDDLCRTSVLGAQGLLQATTTVPGAYQVKVRDQDLGLILNYSRNRFSGASKYNGLPVFTEGAALIDGFKGQSFEMVLNPNHDFGINSLGFDEWGLSQSELILASFNKVEHHFYSQKFGQYLGFDANVSHGVLEVLPSEKLQDPPLEHLEILQFSGLFVDEMSMTFSSEIRLAKWVKKDGSEKFVKGGNFSGSFKDNFKNVKWADEMSLVGVEGEYSVMCPSFAILNDVSVS